MAVVTGILGEGTQVTIRARDFNLARRRADRREAWASRSRTRPLSKRPPAMHLRRQLTTRRRRRMGRKTVLALVAAGFTLGCGDSTGPENGNAYWLPFLITSTTIPQMIETDPGTGVGGTGDDVFADSWTPNRVSSFFAANSGGPPPSGRQPGTPGFSTNTVDIVIGTYQLVGIVFSSEHLNNVPSGGIELTVVDMQMDFTIELGGGFQVPSDEVWMWSLGAFNQPDWWSFSGTAVLTEASLSLSSDPRASNNGMITSGEASVSLSLANVTIDGAPTRSDQRGTFGTTPLSVEGEVPLPPPPADDASAGHPLLGNWITATGGTLLSFSLGGRGTIQQPDLSGTCDTGAVRSFTWSATSSGPSGSVTLTWGISSICGSPQPSPAPITRSYSVSGNTLQLGTTTYTKK